ncbi:MAG: PhoD-like phosphatase N-terminal domain-containing protein, partial [Saprospiraceae bacterium]|nr:PhoD-like phosphatase N-terminal domain-containing protein [Saprospiraceae bacterium]
MNNLFPFLLLTSFLSYSSCIHEKTKYETTDGTEAFFVEAAAPFYHGVASGDPGITSVLIWTRLTPQDSGEVHGTWTMSTSDQFEIPIQSGKFSTSQDSDYTVKVVVPDLLPDTRYYYRFRALGKTSVIGQTKTLPAVLDSDLVLAVVSCSNYEAGYYNAFRALANMDEVDAILHLGDYIYEYQPGR